MLGSPAPVILHDATISHHFLQLSAQPYFTSFIMLRNTYLWPVARALECAVCSRQYLEQVCRVFGEHAAVCSIYITCYTTETSNKITNNKKGLLIKRIMNEKGLLMSYIHAKNGGQLVCMKKSNFFTLAHVQESLNSSGTRE